MSAQLLTLIEVRVDKEKIIYILDNEGDNVGFNFLVTHMQKEIKNSSWSSTCIINNALKKNYLRIINSLIRIIKSIIGKQDGHQRELLKVVRKMTLSEKNEGLFFDTCMQFWEGIKKKPATRNYAGLSIIEMAKKYTDIINQLDYLTSPYYTKTLSPVIKRIFERELTKLN
tara:strand:+ start:328 stop:840 length:513 start_codon:yes stop_codon:yes gene_type:complete